MGTHRVGPGTATLVQPLGGHVRRAVAATEEVDRDAVAFPVGQVLEEIGAGHPLGQRDAHQAGQPDDGRTVGSAQVAADDRFAEDRVADAAGGEVHVRRRQEQPAPRARGVAHPVDGLRARDGIEGQAEDAVDVAPEVRRGAGTRRDPLRHSLAGAAGDRLRPGRGKPRRPFRAQQRRDGGIDRRGHSEGH